MSKIFVVGFIGVGKSTVSKLLSEKLGYDFVDTDVFLEKKHNETIDNIFETRGEDYFRALESAALQDIINNNKDNNVVVACGGGMPCFNNNLDAMKNNGVVIYLSSTRKILYERLLYLPQKRYLIKDKNNKELSYFVVSELRKREHYYKQAHHVINNSKSIFRTVQAMINLLITSQKNDSLRK